MKKKTIFTALAAVTAFALVLTAVFSFKSTALPMTKSVERRFLSNGSEYVTNGLIFTELEDGTYEVGYNYNSTKPSGTVVIPETVNGRRVTRIAEAGFYNCSKLTNVSVPDSVTGAGVNAFTGTAFLNAQSGPVKYAGKIAVYCDRNAVDVTVKDGTLGLADRLFSLAEGLKTAVLPASLVHLGNMTFDGCSKLTTVNIPGGITAIGSGVFNGCSSLRSVSIPSGVTSIGSYAFANSGVTSADIPNVTEIGKGAFEGSNLSAGSVTVGGGYIDIGGRAFAGTSFYNSLGNEKYLGSVFIGCNKNAESVYIREGTTAIAGMAFSGCGSLRSVRIPASVKTIGGDAFFNCAKLVGVTIPEGVESIGENAFRLCGGITSVSLPKSLKTAGTGAFYGCTSVNTVEYPGSVSDMAKIDCGDGDSLPRGSVVKLGSEPKTVSPVNDLRVNYTDHDSAALSWSKPSLATGYRVEVSKNGRWTYAGWTDAPSFTVTGLSQCSTYDIRVYAAVGSVLSTAVQTSAQTKLAPVTNVKTEPDTHEITLSWDGNDLADSYQVDIFKDGKWSFADKVTGTSCTVTGLTTKTEYLFRIYSFRGSEYSSAATAVATAADPYELKQVKGLTAEPSTDSIELSWNSQPAADSYQVDIFKDGKWSYVDKTSDTSYTAEGLSPDTGYRFRVYAFRGSAYGPFAEITVSTKALASSKPAFVTGLEASPSSDSITLSWSKSADADSYQVDMYKNGKWTYVAKTSGTSYTVSGLAPGTSYQFRVFAFRGSEYSYSAGITASTKASAPDRPSSVTGLKATAYGSSVALSWNGSAGADSYQVDMYKNGKWSYIAKVTDTSYTVTGLEPGTVYDLRVFAFKGNAYSSSAGITVATAAASARPDPVTGLAAVTGSDSISLYWDKSPGADSYQVDMYKDGKWTYVAKTSGTYCTINDLYADTAYQLRVYAFKGSLYSPSTGITAYTNLGAASWGKPAAVSGLSASRGSSSITLAWNRSNTADSYQIDMYKNGNWTYLAKISGTSYTVMGLAANTNYDFRVFAFRGSQYSSSSGITVSTSAVLAPEARLSEMSAPEIPMPEAGVSAVSVSEVRASATPMPEVLSSEDYTAAVLAPEADRASELSGGNTLLRGIDVSGWQGTIDFNAVKESGVDYVIIKAGQQYSTVPTWETNYANAKKAGLKVGAYWYSYADTLEEGRQEARSFMAAMKGKQFDFPVYLDIEESDQFEKGTNFVSQLIDMFCGELERSGYYTGVYCSTNWFRNVVSESVRAKRPAWIADYRGGCYYDGAYGAWQYGAGPVSGVEFDSDLNWGYVDYSQHIRANRFNGY